MKRHKDGGRRSSNGGGRVSKHILITGGAGFIGSHLADELLGHGYRVRALDNLCEQVHGPDRIKPDYLSKDVELITGDVRDASAVEKALEGIDAVYHFASAVGVGQSMYEIDKYMDVNCRGTAVLLEAVVKRPVERLIVASSMSIYGEGLYRSNDGSCHSHASRTLKQLKEGKWEVMDGHGRTLEPVKTPESKPPSFSSIYALTKFDQERSCLITGQAYRIPTAALRFFNVFGTRQAFSNPYTGVLAIFTARLLNGKPPVIYEDGRQMRDFVSVYDVARACRLALESGEAPGKVINIGSGEPVSILDVAGRMGAVFGKEIEPEVMGKYRMGDIRHCFSDITLAKQTLEYEPSVTLEDGLKELSSWVEGRVAHDRVAEASAELACRGLTI